MTRKRRTRKELYLARLEEDRFRLVPAAERLSKVSTLKKPPIYLAPNRKLVDPPPYCRRALYSDLLPLSLVADRFRPGAIAEVADLIRRRADGAHVLLSGWLRLRVQGSRVTYDPGFPR